MITAENLTKRFGDRTVLDGVSTRIEPGEVVCLIGPSGGGKTTLLRCLNGLEHFEAGSLTVGQHQLGPGGGRANRDALFAIRQKVGFVFQQWHLFAHKSALGNVIEAPVHVKGVPLAEATEKARHLLDRVGMLHRADAYPHEMSGGEQQRVAIARSLALGPEALLLDEPTSALDPERVDDVIELLKSFQKEGLSMVIVTHEMRFARLVSSRVLVLHGGKIVEQGEPTRVLQTPEHPRTRAFLGLD